MELEIDYWMLDVIEELLKNQKYENHKGKWADHKGCSVNCDNRWCKRYGQLNSISLKIQNLKDECSKQLMGEKE